MGRLFSFRLKGEEARVETQTIRCWCHWHDRTQLPTSPSISETVFRHSLPDDRAGSVQTTYSFQAGWAYLSTSATTASICYTGALEVTCTVPSAEKAPPPLRPVRQFTQLGMPLSRAFQRLVEGGLIVPLPPRPPP